MPEHHKEWKKFIIIQYNLKISRENSPGIFLKMQNGHKYHHRQLNGS